MGHSDAQQYKELEALSVPPPYTAASFLKNLHSSKLTLIVNAPPALNGLALGNVGAAVALNIILRDNGVYNSASSWIVFGPTLYSLILLLLYLVRVLWNFEAFWREDCAKPQPLSAIGAHSMAVMLVALVAALPELQLDYRVPLAIASYGSAVQLGAMLLFLQRCFEFRCWPEPFYNAAIHSCQFLPLAFPSASSACINFRKTMLIFGLVMLLPSLPAQIYRTLTQPQVVAQNYTVCIMQAAFSISLSAWITFPLYDSGPATGPGAVVTHLLFALSTTTYLFTWCALFQRFEALRKLGLDHATISSATFPFINSAISANLYRIVMKQSFSSAGHGVLQAWVYLITLFALGTTLTGNIVYARNAFFTSCPSSSFSASTSFSTDLGEESPEEEEKGLDLKVVAMEVG